jgi:hypothetical protein
MEILQPEDGSPVTYSSTNLPIELQSKEKTSKASLIIDYGSLEQTLGDHTRLGEYKKDINNFYGFSIKSWGENKDFKQFSQSSII